MSADRPAKNPKKQSFRAGDRRDDGSRRTTNRQSGRGRRGESDAHAAIVKGRHAVMALLQHAPQRILALHVWSRDRAHVAAVQELATANNLTIVEHAPDERLAADNLAQGLAVRVRPYAYAQLDALLAAPAPILLCLDSITDPRNLGAILRSAAFFGATGVIVPRDRACPVTAPVERISRGATATMPIAQVTNLARTIGQLRDAGIRTVATVIAPDAEPLTPAIVAPPIAIVVGGEERGVRRLVAERCDGRIVLPASGPMQSLNVASFASIALAFCRLSRV